MLTTIGTRAAAGRRRGRRARASGCACGARRRARAAGSATARGPRARRRHAHRAGRRARAGSARCLRPRARTTHGPGALMPMARPPRSRTARSCASTRNRRLMSTVVRCATVTGMVSDATTRARRRERAERRRVLDRARRRRGRYRRRVVPHAARRVRARRRVRRRGRVPRRPAGGTPTARCPRGRARAAGARRVPRSRCGHRRSGARAGPGRARARGVASRSAGRSGCGGGGRSPRLVGGLLAVDDRPPSHPGWCRRSSRVSAFGVYLCVPDTEAPKALLGALLAARGARRRAAPPTPDRLRHA